LSSAPTGKRARELCLRQREEEIRLILAGIGAALEAISPRLRVEVHLRVMAGRDGLGPECFGALHERRKLQVAVAVNAWNRRTSRRVLAHEIRDDVLLELALEIDDVVGDPDRARHAPRVVEIVDSAAAAEPHFTLRLSAL